MHALLLTIISFAALTDAERTTIRGEVRDATGRRIAGARIDIIDAKPLAGEPLFTGYLDCNKFVFTDQNGAFEISDLDPTLQFRLRAVAFEHNSSSTQWRKPADGPINIRLPEQPHDVPANRIVFGKMADAGGQPITGALLQAIGAKTKTKHWRGPVNDVDVAVSGDDGSFKMILAEDYIWVDLRLRAPHHLGADVIQIKPGHEVHNQFFLTKGTQIVGRLLHDGQPAARQKLAVSQLPSRYSAFFKTIAVTTDDNGRFEFANLPPNQTFVIFSPGTPVEPSLVLPTKRFSSGNNGETRDLGGLNSVPGSRLTGKIVVPEGQNLPAHSRLILERDAAFDSIAVEIGADGRFAAEGLPPEPYEFWLAANGWEFDTRQMAVQSTGYRHHDTNQFAMFLGQSRENLQIPVRVVRAAPKPDQPNGRLPGTVKRNQSLRGIVLDPRGLPLENAVVSWRLIDDTATGANAPGEGLTSADGSFALDNLPDAPLELEVAVRFIQVPQGWTHRSQYPARVDPEMNQQDVVIIYDSSLNYQIETIETRLNDKAIDKSN
jgi:hypothetical protein